MKKKVLTILTALLALALVFGIVACKEYVEPNDSDKDEQTITRFGLINNGTFYDTTGSAKDDYLKTKVPDWTANSGSLTTSNANMGVIDMSNSSAFGSNQELFNTLGTDMTTVSVDPSTPYEKDSLNNPTTTRQDTNALVIASTQKEGSLFYKSAAITLEANKYYCLQYSVLTNIDKSKSTLTDEQKAKKGAWVEIIGGLGYKEGAIDTKGVWQTQRVYIESNKDEKQTIYVKLWLGYDSDGSDYNAQGAVFFDNIIMREITTLPNDEVIKADDTKYANHNKFLNAQKAKENRAFNEYEYRAFESIFYIPDQSFEQVTDYAPTSSYKTSGRWNTFRDGRQTYDNTAQFALKEPGASLTKSNYGIVDMAKLYGNTGTTAEPKWEDLYQKRNNNSTTWNRTSDKAGKEGLTYDVWKTLMDNDWLKGKDNDTSMLMIYNNDLTSAGFVSDYKFNITKGTYYKISLNVYVWEVVRPTFTKTTIEPGNQYYSIMVAYEAKDEVKYGISSVYFNEGKLTEDEKTLVKKEAKDYYPNNTTAIADKIAGKADSWIKAPTQITDPDEDGKVLNDLYKIMPYFFAVKNFTDADYETQAKVLYNGNTKWDSLTDEQKAAEVTTLKDYVKWLVAKEKSSFFGGSTYKNFVEKYKEHNESAEKEAEFNLKYSIWESANPQPKAKIKLTGVGKDNVVETTETGKWEEVVFILSGNQLSDRKLSMEYWFGEGDTTDYSTQMMGGALFDNLQITEYKDFSEASADAASLKKEIINLAEIKNQGDMSYGDLAGDHKDDNVSDKWTTTLNGDQVAAGDKASVTLTKQPNSTLTSVTVNGSPVAINELKFSNEILTASVLESKDWSVKINPNTAYRFAVWVKTEGFDTGKFATLSLMSGDENIKIETNSKSVSGVNYSDYKEVVFYIVGGKTEAKYVNLKIELGSGSRFSTDSYVKGSVYISMINCMEIEHLEYENKASGDVINQVSFRESASNSDSVTNGNFEDVVLGDTDEKEFDDNGKLVGTAVTASWTADTIKKNTFNTVTLETLLDGSAVKGIKWKRVYGINYKGEETQPTAYEVYAKFKKDNEDKEVMVAYVSFVDGKESYEYAPDLTVNKNASFRVRAVSEVAVGEYSKYIALEGKQDGAEYAECAESVNKKEHKSGTIYYKDSEDKDYEFKSALASEGNKAPYVSPFSTGLKLTSNYDVIYTLKSSSKSLSTDSYYRVSVWVKTVGTAKASVTITNPSKTLHVINNTEGKSVGYTNINTGDEWIQYTFYIKTGSVSSSVSLELSLGNPYGEIAKKKNDKVTSAINVYEESSLSKGTVYFDNVRVIASTNEEYNDYLKDKESDKVEDNDKAYSFDYVWVNKYYTRVLESTIDSFDSNTPNSNTDSTSDTYYLGATPNNYRQSSDSNAKPNTTTERMYGVYSYETDLDKLLRLVTSKNTKDDDITDYLLGDKYPELKKAGEVDDKAIVDTLKKFITIDGKNSLVMANKYMFAQDYTSNSTTIASKTYYKLTFTAKALAYIVGSEDALTDAYATFRFMPTGSVSKFNEIRIPTGAINQLAQEYTMYIYNPKSSSSSATWSFSLGVSTQYVKGLLAIDTVNLTTITEDVYVAQKTAYDKLSTEEKVNGSYSMFAYDPDKEVEDEEDEDKDESTTTDKGSIWDKGEAWLLISSLVIAVMIIIVLVIVIVKKWRKKHPKEITGDSIVKAEKEIKVEKPDFTKKDVYDDDTYMDKPEKPVYNQRVVTKKKKKK